jgi:hypothetical protein
MEAVHTSETMVKTLIALKMEALQTSETFVNTYTHRPEDGGSTDL